jgi:SAM-dependent methyltransferase
VQADVAQGYINLLGNPKPSRKPGQMMMSSPLLARIYERFWRPIGVRIMLTGLTGPGTKEEHRIALEMLSIASGDRVLDVGCGPGNFTRDFADAAGDGLVVGIDASDAMLEVAVRNNAVDNVAYVRGDAGALPFRDASFDAVCCFAALYFIEEPMRALEEVVRVLAPGGRVALLSTCNRGPLPLSVANFVVRGASGMRVFGREELTQALAGGGLVDIEQRLSGFAQFVSGRKLAP